MRFTVYSKEGCPYCEKIEQVLQSAGLEHKIYKLDEDFTRDGFMDQFGYGSTFPQVVLNDQENLGGCVDTVRYLQENNII